jgi:integrase
MAEKLDNRNAKKIPTPKDGNAIYWDTEVRGFGLRITPNGVRAFILNYRTRSGRMRRYTIGQMPEWNVIAARNEAKDLKRKIERGDDPLAAIRADREAPTVADMCQRFIEEHLPKKRPSTGRDYKAHINNQILPKLRHFKVAEVTFADIDGLHRKITKSPRTSKKRKITKEGAPYQANRCVAVLSKMFSLAIRWGWRTDNPARGLERNQENKRERYLSPEELVRLSEALAKYPDQQAANIIRLLMLTGARSGEVRAMRWADINGGIWTKPGATTKQKTFHRVPLSAPAQQLLAKLQDRAAEDAEFVFPGRYEGHRIEFKKAWGHLCKAARINDARPHDLRHTYASVLASSGHSLPIIGRLLGHTQAATTQRYAHLQDDPLKLATERVGAILNGKSHSKGKVVQIGKR